jgi:alkylation response protein AidB-like acyl-CoA dehydrogenase
MIVMMNSTIFTEYGGMGLDYTYSVAMNEALGHIDCGGIPMAIAVQTDVSTPALARWVRLPASGFRLAVSESGSLVRKFS